MKKRKGRRGEARGGCGKKKKSRGGISSEWAIGDSNPGPTGYEPGALTN